MKFSQTAAADRRAAEFDGRAVTCPKASLIGYSTNLAKPGAFLITKDGQMARMLARVRFAPGIESGPPVSGFILALVLGSNGRFLVERWIDPADVREVYEKSPAELMAFFFAPQLPHSAPDLLKLVRHGTLSEESVKHCADRLAMFNAREGA